MKMAFKNTTHKHKRQEKQKKKQVKQWTKCISNTKWNQSSNEKPERTNRTETEEKSKPNYIKAANCIADRLYNNCVYNPMDPGPSRIKTKNTR